MRSLNDLFELESFVSSLDLDILDYESKNNLFSLNYTRVELETVLYLYLGGTSIRYIESIVDIPRRRFYKLVRVLNENETYSQERKVGIFFSKYGWRFDDPHILEKSEELYLKGLSPSDIISGLDLGCSVSTFNREIYSKFKSPVYLLESVWKKRKNRKNSVALCKHYSCKSNLRNLSKRIAKAWERKERRCKLCKRMYYINLDADEYCKGCKYILKIRGPYPVRGKDYVECPYCGKFCSSVGGNHLKSHGKTYEDLFRDYPRTQLHSDAYMSNRGVLKYNDSNQYVSGWNKSGKRIEYTTLSGDKLTLKSKWEESFATYMDESLEHIWEYETLKFTYIDPRGCIRVYTPDFYVEELNTVFEVKPIRHIRDTPDLIERKMMACIDAGYIFRLVTERSLYSGKLSLKLIEDDSEEVIKEIRSLF